jgi:hypothetical protein
MVDYRLPPQLPGSREHLDRTLARFQEMAHALDRVSAPGTVGR